MLEYFRSLKYENYTLSIDNVVLNYYLPRPMRERFSRLLEQLEYRYCCDLKHWDNFKIGAYKMNFTITFSDGNSFWIGWGLNQGKTIYGSLRLEFNPNKVARHDCFRTILAYLNGNTNPMHQNISRYDLAIDYPCLRENAFITKDRRKYTQISNSASDKTEYLGIGSQPGRVKLYNKQIESKLSYPLTRLELTLDPQTRHEELPIPDVRFLNDMQICFSETMNVDATDRCLLMGVLAGVFAVSDLSRRKRKVIESLLDLYTVKFKLPIVQYELIRAQLKSFFEYPGKPLDAHETDLDILKDYAYDPTLHMYKREGFEEFDDDYDPFEDD